MSLLGRLEDLSLTDIIQIVYLSRRTGVLEIINEVGRHTVLFRQGLVVNAASPEYPDLVAFLEGTQLLNAAQAKMVRQMEENGISAGMTILEMNILSKDDLANAVRQRVLNVVTPLLLSKEGEFNFILSETMSAADLEHDPDGLFKDGGLPPNKLLGSADGEKIKPLKGLEESLKAGKALLRGSASAETTPASLNLGLGQPLAAPEPPKLAEAASSDNVAAVPEACFDRSPERSEGTRRVHADRRRVVVHGARGVAARGAARAAAGRRVGTVQGRGRVVRSRVAGSGVPQRGPLRAQPARARRGAAGVHERGREDLRSTAPSTTSVRR